jgi:hypothetical protein
MRFVEDITRLNGNGALFRAGKPPVDVKKKGGRYELSHGQIFVKEKIEAV